MDAWNPSTFDNELHETLEFNSDLIVNYFSEDRFLMDEHLNSEPYESLKPNRFYADFSYLSENVVTPLLADRRIRVWHYTRLLDCEVEEIRRKLIPSTHARLMHRLDMLVGLNLLTKDDADIVYSQSPFQSQESSRAGRLWTTSIPISFKSSGVEPLLSSWGGESAYFWLKDGVISDKLRCIGAPRIVEIETALRDKLNAYRVSNPVLQSWAKSLGQPVSVEGSDLAISDCLRSAKVLAVHTLGDGIFESVATSYPGGCSYLVEI